MTGYQAAYDQAKRERAEIRGTIEHLLARSEMLGKVLDCLAPLVPQQVPAGADFNFAEGPERQEDFPQVSA
ncbi:MAG TPA: hypothetical protein VMV57_12100 [Terracidiphilus sp.]|nr:hypothetical protein [Terracidiphilus sp.]